MLSRKARPWHLVIFGIFYLLIIVFTLINGLSWYRLWIIQSFTITIYFILVLFHYAYIKKMGVLIYILLLIIELTISVFGYIGTYEYIDLFKYSGYPLAIGLVLIQTNYIYNK